MFRAPRLTLFATVAALALVPAGCSHSRPANIATEPGDSYVELSNLQLEVVGSELRMKVHYRMPDGLPESNAWFACSFEVQGGNAGTVTVRKQGKELSDEGDFEATTNMAFIRKSGGQFSAQVKQSATKGGPYHPVSEKFTIEN